MQRLGIDIGGTGIKGGLVDLERGRLIGERERLKTPDPSPPPAVAEAVAKMVTEMGYEGPIGIGFPSVVIGGVVWSANNIDESWIGVDAGEVFSQATGADVALVNDADAAALCEARYGVARDVPGTVLVLTFGTGIGSGLLHNGRLVPNLQLGNLEIEGHRPAESYFSGAARESEDLSWEEWGGRVNRFLRHVKKLVTPQLIVIGGGVCKRWDQWSMYLDPSLDVVPASRVNNAGIVGAATLVG